MQRLLALYWLVMVSILELMWLEVRTQARVFSVWRRDLMSLSGQLRNRPRPWRSRPHRNRHTGVKGSVGAAMPTWWTSCRCSCSFTSS